MKCICVNLIAKITMCLGPLSVQGDGVVSECIIYQIEQERTRRQAQGTTIVHLPSIMHFHFFPLD